MLPVDWWCFLTRAVFSCGKEMMDHQWNLKVVSCYQTCCPPLRKGSWDFGRDQNGSEKIGEEWKGRNPEQRKRGTKPWRTWRTQAKTKGRASWLIFCAWVTAMFFFREGRVADDNCFVHWVVSAGAYPVHKLKWSMTRFVLVTAAPPR